MYSIYADGVCIYNDVFSLDDVKVVNPKLFVKYVIPITHTIHHCFKVFRYRQCKHYLAGLSKLVKYVRANMMVLELLLGRMYDIQKTTTRWWSSSWTRRTSSPGSSRS